MASSLKKELFSNPNTMLDRARAWSLEDLIHIRVARCFTAARKFLRVLVMLGSDASKLLELVEEPLDRVTLAIDP